MIKTAFALFLSCLFLFSCKKSGSTDSDNGITIYNVSQYRLDVSSTFTFEVYLDKPATTDITVNYATQPGTALADKDYVTKTGTLTIPAGQNRGTIPIEVKGDSLRRESQLFFVQLSNPKNATLKVDKGTGTIKNDNGLYFPVDNAGYSTPATYPGYTLTWSDEFNGRSVDGTAWTFESGNNGGWGNNELENYTGRSENVFVSSGNLIIEARNETFGAQNYTSTRMITKNKKVFKFGRIDIRAKMPKGKGIWPALWMLGNNIDVVNWPNCGEIDILELLGHEPNKIYGTMHWGTGGGSHASKGGNYVLGTGSFDQQFHVYSIIWKQDSIKVLIDDQEYVQVTKADVGATYPFNADFFFIFNIAVGGNWPGAPDATTVFPQRMIVDYVRVFQ